MSQTRLLLVTDHVYFAHEEEYYDNFGFDYAFFRGYLDVFDHVDVLCRMENRDSADGLVKSSGPGLEFHGTPNIHGLSWFLNSRKYFYRYKDLIDKADAICYRIPATAAWNVHLINQKRKNSRPHMFEFVGDPMDALFSVNDSPLKRAIMKTVGKVHSARMKAISDTAVSGSYVSKEHLQQKFPPPKGVDTEAISSIRLDEKYIREEPRPLRETGPVKIIQTASFVRQKNQSYLVRILDELIRRGHRAEVHFVGAGPEQKDVRDLTASLGLEDKVVFHNQVTGFDRIVELLDSSDIFCLPSFSEGVPRSMIEAMARGLVCVGTPIGGILELIDRKYTFGINKTEEAADLFESLLSRRDEWMSIGRENISRATEYSQTVLIPRRTKVFTQLLNIAQNG